MVNFEEEMSLTRNLMDELKAELAASPDPLATAIERPADGMCAARAHGTKPLQKHAINPTACVAPFHLSACLCHPRLTRREIVRFRL